MVRTKASRKGRVPRKTRRSITAAVKKRKEGLPPARPVPEAEARISALQGRDLTDPNIIAATKTAIVLSVVGGMTETSAAHSHGALREFRKWKADDEVFRQDLSDADLLRRVSLEDACYARALKGSDTLAMFMLKAYFPDKFGEHRAGGSNADVLDALRAVSDIMQGVRERPEPLTVDSPNGDQPSPRSSYIPPALPEREPG